MKELKFITEQDYQIAVNSEINLPISINNYDLEALHLAELVRSEVINRYGIRAYEEGGQFIQQSILSYKIVPMMQLQKDYLSMIKGMDGEIKRIIMINLEVNFLILLKVWILATFCRKTM